MGASLCSAGAAEARTRPGRRTMFCLGFTAELWSFRGLRVQGFRVQGLGFRV